MMSASVNDTQVIAFSLQMRKGSGVVRIHDSVLMAESKYKALLISENTTVEEVIRMLFHCYGLERVERPENFCVYEQCQSQCYERRLNERDRPVQVQSLWPSPSQFMFVLRRSINERKVECSVSDQLRISGVKSGLDSAGVSPVNSERDEEEEEEDAASSSESSTGSTVASFQMSTPTKYFSKPSLLRPPQFSGPRSLPSFDLPPPPPTRPKFNLNMTSIHESGLPPPPALKPKPPLANHSLLSSSSLLQLSSTSSATASNRASLGSLSSGSRSSSASFHDYENYFYI